MLLSHFKFSFKEDKLNFRFIGTLWRAKGVLQDILKLADSIFFAGANANKQDLFGRSPLHVASAVDYAEMVDFLLQNGADVAITTYGEEQSPLHYAAKNDAVNSLHTLLGHGADIDARDSKNRTPLQVYFYILGGIYIG